MCRINDAVSEQNPHGAMHFGRNIQIKHLASIVPSKKQAHFSLMFVFCSTTSERNYETQLKCELLLGEC